MAFTFKPGPPRPVEVVSTTKLRAQTALPRAAKPVGSGVIKIYTDGTTDYLVRDTPALRKYLAQFAIYP
jgi:hypothetical protein